MEQSELNTAPPALDVTAAVLTSLRRIIRAIDLHSRKLVTQFGLTGPQLVVLNELAHGGPRSVSALAAAVHLSQATVTGITDRLAQHGHVERTRSTTDRRKVVIVLTDQGRQTLADAPAPLQAQFTRAFGHLADWEQTQILSSLQRLVAMMEASELDATPMLATGPLDITTERIKRYITGEAAADPQASAHASAPAPGVPSVAAPVDQHACPGAGDSDDARTT